MNNGYRKVSKSRLPLVFILLAIIGAGLGYVAFRYMGLDGSFLEIFNKAKDEVVAAETPAPSPSPTQSYIAAVIHQGEDFAPAAAPVELVEYEGAVEHIFFHPLIVFPELAFDNDRHHKGFDDWFVTIPEFKRIIESLHKNDFILVRFEDFTEVDENGNVVEKPLMIPSGKKPLVISLDDVNYYQYMRENGLAHSLVLDEYGDVAAYAITPDGKPLTSRDIDIIPILDDFVKEHPDFSHNGMKAYIGLTGYEGVLGYRTDHDQDNYEKEIEKLKPIIETLKRNGWEFASHSYSHYSAAVITHDKLQSDTQKWLAEVGSLVGEPYVYLYPFGDPIPYKDNKFGIMEEAGIRVLAGVGPEPYFRYDGKTMTTQRRHIDGIALRYQNELNAQFYNADEVIDLESRDGVTAE